MEKLLIATVFLVLALGSFSGSQVIFENKQSAQDWQWDALDSGQKLVVGWDKHAWETEIATIPENVRRQLPTIAWDREFPILVSLGERPTGGYAVRITQVMIEDNSLVIMIKRRSPRPEEFVTMALTHPYDLVVLDRAKVRSINRAELVNDQGEKIAGF